MMADSPQSAPRKQTPTSSRALMKQCGPSRFRCRHVSRFPECLNMQDWVKRPEKKSMPCSAEAAAFQGSLWRKRMGRGDHGAQAWGMKPGYSQRPWWGQQHVAKGTRWDIKLETDVTARTWRTWYPGLKDLNCRLTVGAAFEGRIQEKAEWLNHHFNKDALP